MLREELLTDPACVFRCCHCVAHSSGVCEDLMVIATLQRHNRSSRLWFVLVPGCCHPDVPGLGRFLQFISLSFQERNDILVTLSKEFNLLMNQNRAQKVIMLMKGIRMPL